MLRNIFILVSSFLISFNALAMSYDEFTKCEGENYGPYVELNTSALESSSAYSPSIDLLILDQLRAKMEEALLLNLEGMKSCIEAYEFLQSHEKQIVEIVNTVNNFAKD